VPKAELGRSVGGEHAKTSGSLCHENGFDGMILGHRISYTVTGSDGKPLLSETTQKLVHSSFAVVHEKYFVNVPSGQIAGGLTEFYKDFRNRKIRIEDAVPVGTSEIAGSPAK
jgi:hypothetical protein